MASLVDETCEVVESCDPVLADELWTDELTGLEDTIVEADTSKDAEICTVRPDVVVQPQFARVYPSPTRLYSTQYCEADNELCRKLDNLASTIEARTHHFCTLVLEKQLSSHSAV